ncbi:MAG: M16 family metallopeptidase [Synechococcus sp.]
MKSPIYHVQLENGIRLLAIEKTDVDTVAAHFYWQGGASANPVEQAGLAHLTSALVTKGTRNYCAQTIAESVESIGALLGAECATDYDGLALKSVSSDFPSLLNLASEIIRYPSFPDRELERERQLTLQAIRSQQERPFAAAMTPLRRALFGAHPYAESMAGTLESVSILTRNDIANFHYSHIRPDTTVIAICGNISADKIEHLVRCHFGDWTNPNTLDYVPTPQPELPVLQEERRLNTFQDTQQTIAILGYRAPSIYSQDWVALKLLTVHLGGGLSSRLFSQLREKQGLAYDVSASYSSRRWEAPLIAHIGMAPSNTEQAIAGLQAEVERVRDQPLTERELTLAKRKIIGQYALSKQTNAQVAQLMGWYEMLGLGVERDRTYPQEIEALSVEAILKAAREHLRHPVISVAGPVV